MECRKLRIILLDFDITGAKIDNIYGYRIRQENEDNVYIKCDLASRFILYS